MNSRTFYLDLLNENVKNPRMIAHSLASEAVLRALATKLNQDVDLWGIAGLMHDVDVEVTEGDSHRHGLVAVDMLKGILPDEAIDAIKMHNEVATGLERTTMFQHAVAAGETITGLIFATAMVYPDRKISSVKAKSVVKRMKETHFAASVKRQNIMECEKLGLPIDQFAQLALDALTPIQAELGF